MWTATQINWIIQYHLFGQSRILWEEARWKPFSVPSRLSENQNSTVGGLLYYIDPGTRYILNHHTIVVATNVDAPTKITSRNKLNDSVIATTAKRFGTQHSMIKTCQRTKGKAVSGLQVIRWLMITRWRQSIFDLSRSYTEIGRSWWNIIPASFQIGRRTCRYRQETGSRGFCSK